MLRNAMFSQNNTKQAPSIQVTLCLNKNLSISLQVSGSLLPLRIYHNKIRSTRVFDTIQFGNQSLHNYFLNPNELLTELVIFNRQRKTLRTES